MGARTRAPDAVEQRGVTLDDVLPAGVVGAGEGRVGGLLGERGAVRRRVVRGPGALQPGDDLADLLRPALGDVLRGATHRHLGAIRCPGDGDTAGGAEVGVGTHHEEHDGESHHGDDAPAPSGSGKPRLRARGTPLRRNTFLTWCTWIPARVGRFVDRHGALLLLLAALQLLRRCKYTREPWT